MQMRPQSVYRALRILEHYGATGCTVAQFAEKYWSLREVPEGGWSAKKRRNGTAGQMLRALAAEGLIVRTGDMQLMAGDKKADISVHYLAAAGRKYLAEAFARGVARAQENALARQADRERFEDLAPR